MGILSKAKGLVGGNKAKAKEGVDKAADVVEKKVGPEHADEVDKGAEVVKKAIDKVD